MADMAFPYGVDSSGRTGIADEDRHVRDLVEQVLLTSPGERVNRPTFGAPLLQLAFAPGSDAMTAAAQATVQAALQAWLGDRIDVEQVSVSSDGSTLEVEVAYRVRRTQEPVRARFQRSL